jgi:DNA replication protein DnaC
MQILLNATSLTSRQFLSTSNLPFQEWNKVLCSERLTSALLGRLAHHVHILKMYGDTNRLKQSKHKRSSQPGR